MFGKKNGELRAGFYQHLGLTKQGSNSRAMRDKIKTVAYEQTKERGLMPPYKTSTISTNTFVKNLS